MHRSSIWLAAGCALAVTVAPAADEVRYVEENGITYRETRRVVRRPIYQTELQSQQRTVYRPQVSTELQTVERSYPVPITRLQWVPCWQRTWNPFAPPELVYRQVPVTTWETRHEKVRVPVSRTQMVAEAAVDRVPVMAQRFVEDVYTTRVAVASRPRTVAAQPAAGAAADQAPSRADNDSPAPDPAARRP